MRAAIRPAARQRQLPDARKFCGEVSFDSSLECATTGLFRLDVGCPDHLAPLLGLRGNVLAEIGRRAWKHCATQVSKPRFRVRIGRAAFISLLSFSTISGDVFLGAPTPNQVLVS